MDKISIALIEDRSKGKWNGEQCLECSGFGAKIEAIKKDGRVIFIDKHCREIDIKSLVGRRLQVIE